jgi:hypothetical protein
VKFTLRNRRRAGSSVLQPATVTVRRTELVLSLTLLAIFLGARDLPLVDLPQHALQIANWIKLNAHDPTVSELELNFRTPYLLAYPVARALASVLPILIALKVTLWASITLQAVTLRKLGQRLGHDPWLGLLGFPLGFGYSFCFGLIAFCAALPLVNWALLAGVDHRQRPTLRSGLMLGSTLALLLVAHGVALGFLLLSLGPLLLSGGGKWWQRWLPWAAPVLLGALWLVPGGSATRLGGDLWVFEPRRLLELPGQLVGIGSADPLATLLGLLLLVAVGSSLGARRSALLVMPLVGTLLGYLFFPTMFRGAGPLGPRFTAYLVPALLIAFEPRYETNPTPGYARRGLILLVACGVLLVFSLRLRGFNREASAFHALTARLPPGLAVRPIVFDRASTAFPGIPAHLHLPAYYALEKGGSAGYSFAMYSISVVRLRAGVEPKMAGGAEWAPERFDAQREADDYGYFIVRSAVDRTSSLFPGPAPIAVLDQHIGDWWGYRRVERVETAGSAKAE